MSTLAATSFVEQISSSPGVYFDYVGKVKAANGHLSIVIPIDISHIKSHIENINSVLETVMYFCNRTQDLHDSECENILEPLTIRYRDMIKEYSSITHLVDDRIKRGAWVGGIGTALKQIFGTLDEDDAIKYDNAINNVQDDQKRITSLVKEHILVTKSTLTRFNETMYRLKSNEDKLNLAVDKLSVNLKDLYNKTDHLLLISKLNTVYNSLETSILTLSFQLEDITNAILLSNTNAIHPFVITPQELYKELTDNYKYLPNELEFVVPLKLKLIHVIMNMSKLISYYLDKKIVFVIMIPLTNPLEFNLFNNIPLPIPHNVTNPNSFSVIIPSSKYIAITKDKTHYSNINNLDNCEKVDYQNYLCKILYVFPTSANPSCESDLLSKVISSIPTHCKTEFVRGDLDVWKPLQSNRWIFVQSKPSKLTVDCYNLEPLEIKIIGTGIVHIPDYCKAYCKNVKLLPNHNMLNITIPVLDIDFNLLNDSCCNFNEFKKLADSVPLLKLNNIDLENLPFSKNIDKETLQELDKIIKKPHFIKYGAHYSILAISIIVIILLLFVCLLYNKINKAGSPNRKLRTPKIIFKRETLENIGKQPESDVIELADVQIESKHLETPSSPKIRSKI